MQRRDPFILPLLADFFGHGNQAHPIGQGDPGGSLRAGLCVRLSTSTPFQGCYSEFGNSRWEAKRCDPGPSTRKPNKRWDGIKRCDPGPVTRSLIVLLSSLGCQKPFGKKKKRKPKAHRAACLCAFDNPKPITENPVDANKSIKSIKI